MSFVQTKKDKIFFNHYTSEDKILEKLSPGIYKVEEEYSFMSKTIYLTNYRPKQELVSFTTGIMADIKNDIDTFLKEDTVNLYQKMKLTHKLGILLYGKPGVGKTALSELILSTMVTNHNAIGLICTGVDLMSWLHYAKEIRKCQNNPIVIFYDEVDTAMRKEEERYLPFLDGHESIESLIFIGATNYLNKITDRIKNRKSRIKACFELTSLPYEVYKEYLMKKADFLKFEKIEEMAFKAEENGLTIDELKHCLLFHVIDRQTIDNSIISAKEQFKEISSMKEED